MDVIMSSAKWQSVLVDLDDIVVLLQNANSHMMHLRKVLTLFRDVGATLKLKNCSIFTGKTNYLVHAKRPGRLELQEARIAAECVLKVPTTQPGLRSFLGPCNVVRRFVPSSSRVAVLSEKKLRKDQLTSFPTSSRRRRTQ